jgi:hypothetical protein
MMHSFYKIFWISAFSEISRSLALVNYSDGGFLSKIDVVEPFSGFSAVFHGIHYLFPPRALA